jgi:tetratricopeptide (TPR) repeat protein
MRDAIAIVLVRPSIGRTLALAIALAGTASSAQADRILLHGAQSPINGVTVENEDFNEVTYKRPNVPDAQRIRSRDVSDIEREPGSEPYDAGREQRKQGDFANAVKSFQLALSKDGSKAWVKEYAQYQIAESQFALGLSDPREMQAALQSFEKLKAEFPKSRLLPAVELGIGQCLVELGRFRDAERHLTDLEGNARSRFGIQYELLAKKWNAKAFEREKRFGEAQTKYSSLYQAATKALGDADLKDFEKRRISTLAAEARNLEGTCLILAGQFDRAESFYRGLIREAEPKKDYETLAGAYNGLGESLFNLKQPAEALQAFARTATIYFYADPETAKALYWMGICEESKQPGAPGLAASRPYFDQVVKVFPATEWAAKAKSKLK